MHYYRTVCSQISLKNLFVPIKGYEANYEINIFGDVRSLNTGRIMARGIMTNKREYYHLSKNGRKKSKQIHRLVYENFVGDIEDGFVIDHIDGDYLNNDISNLQMITPRQNLQKSIYRDRSHSGLNGVQRTTSGGWRAFIGGPLGFRKHLGCFDNKAEAHKVYLEGIKEYERTGDVKETRKKYMKRFND